MVLAHVGTHDRQPVIAPASAERGGLWLCRRRLTSASRLGLDTRSHRRRIVEGRELYRRISRLGGGAVSFSLRCRVRGCCPAAGWDPSAAAAAAADAAISSSSDGTRICSVPTGVEFSKLGNDLRQRFVDRFEGFLSALICCFGIGPDGGKPVLQGFHFTGVTGR
jgi:hypothetical protein